MIGLIPARKNSKRFPGKNHALFNGKTLLETTYQSAKLSEVFSEIFISTDDDVLLESSLKLGITVPFKREDDLAQDHTGSWEVVLDFLKRTRYVGGLCLLQLTSPRRSAEDIAQLHALYAEHTNCLALTVKERVLEDESQSAWLCDCSPKLTSDSHCEASVRVVPNGGAYMLHSSSVSTRSFHELAGCIAVLMPPLRSLDIDFKSQLTLAEECGS